MLKKVLKDEYDIRAFTDAEEAIKQILEENIIPTHLFLDVNMPAMDGWEFLEILEEETEGTDLNIKVSMLTSSMFPQDKAKALKSKFVHHYINKPLDPVSVDTIFGD